MRKWQSAGHFGVGCNSREKGKAIFWAEATPGCDMHYSQRSLSVRLPTLITNSLLSKLWYWLGSSCAICAGVYREREGESELFKVQYCGKLLIKMTFRVMACRQIADREMWGLWRELSAFFFWVSHSEDQRNHHNNTNRKSFPWSKTQYDVWRRLE